MAKIEYVKYTPCFIEIHSGKVNYENSERDASHKYIPFIFWDDNTPWREMNLWAVERASSYGVKTRTVESNINCLLFYANFLEKERIKWFEFPLKKSNRCIVIYRGYLIRLRNEGVIKPSTAYEYMRSCLSFYLWVKKNDLLPVDLDMFDLEDKTVRYFDRIGFERTITVSSSELRVPNRKRYGLMLEDGLQPVSLAHRDEILRFVRNNGSYELFLMLQIGFFTGMRLGSICSLKIKTLINAIPDPSAKGLLRISIGPGACPPVDTKYDVTGDIWLPEILHEQLMDYAISLNRASRELKATEENKDVLFLTRFGNVYSRKDRNFSCSVNVEMSQLRKKAAKVNLSCLNHFYFHQSRCTFGTELAKIALSKCNDAALAIAIVSNALLHGNNSEGITLKYIKFVQSSTVKKELSDQYMAAFKNLKEMK